MVKNKEAQLAEFTLPYGKTRLTFTLPDSRPVTLLSPKEVSATPNPEELVRNTTGHELTHAFSAHLRLPMWLNEGLAMRTVDRLFDKPMVKPESLELLEKAARSDDPAGYAKINARDQEAILYHYVRAYWVTRYVEDTQPELLKELLSRRHGRGELDSNVAAAYGMEREEFWGKIDGMVCDHFGV